MTSPERQHPFPGNRLRYARVLNENTTGAYSYERPEVSTDDIARANLLTSEVNVETLPDRTVFEHPPRTAQHRPVLDLDFPARLVPSTTDGHYHLYLDKPMTWTVYVNLLRALAEAGIIERGYANASIQRGYSAVRTPWTRKQEGPAF